VSDITAPMRGKIFKILVNVGDSLAEDDEVVVLDSMKMEISVYSPGEGTVREIKVEVGETVEAEAILITLD
jgi:acetyl-CoA carboxylase biotin carboxyl carrier protein